MNRVRDAVQCFESGFSCSQAVFAAFSEAFGLDREKALQIAQPFGGGIARTGSTCGAVTGALLVIGLKHGRKRLEEDEAKEKTYALVHEFIRRFRAAQGSIICRELIGLDLSTPEGHSEAQRRGVFSELCSKYVAQAVTLLEEIL
jgi:C_GCAxxG_C_C family probable redox protein